MGFFKNSSLIFISIILFISLLLGDITLILSLSINYDSLHETFYPVIKEIVEKQVPNNTIEIMQEACKLKSNFSFKYNESNMSILIPCDKINLGKQEVIDYSINKFLEKIYYDSYECGFWKCITTFKNPFVLVSAKAKDYWMNRFHILFIISLILIGLLFFLIKQKLNFLILVGILILISSIPLKFLNSILVFFLPSLFEPFALFFVSASKNIFLASLIIGFVVFATGLLLKLIKTGDSLLNKIKKNKEEEKE